MKFSDLNNKRKQFVESLIKFHPSIKETGLVTLKQIQGWWEDYGKNPDRTVGYPNWLLVSKELRAARGSYIVPIPQEGDKPARVGNKISKKDKVLKDLTYRPDLFTIDGEETQVVRSITNEEFLNECREYGISV